MIYNRPFAYHQTKLYIEASAKGYESEEKASLRGALATWQSNLFKGLWIATPSSRAHDDD